LPACCFILAFPVLPDFPFLGRPLAGNHNRFLD
jgi:hypothetical protein